MPYARLFACATIVLSLGAEISGVFAQELNQPAKAVVCKGKLIVLDEDGIFRVWTLADEKYDLETASKLARKGLRHLASDGERLWAADDARLYAWTPEENAWKRISDLETKDENQTLEALVVFGGNPFLVYPSKVVSPTASCTYDVPKQEARSRIYLYRVLTHLSTDTMIWIGTGRGEWGGQLVGLNPRTGEWVHHQDSLHYVTGITRDRNDELIVSWSMSHFSASTMIRTHKLDATEKVASPQLDSKYYQTISFSPFDKTLYGIERRRIVTVREGKPKKIARLTGPVFRREPMAMGSAPGIAGLFPIGVKTVVIVPSSGQPLILRDGNLTRLAIPKE